MTGDYFKRITFPDNVRIENYDFSYPPYPKPEIRFDILVKIQKFADKTICNEIINFAKNNGVTDLYLLDEEFVTTALKNEVERRTQPKNHLTE